MACGYCNGCTDPAYYQVVVGDTFYLIAEKFGTTVECLIAENPGVAPLNLLVGTVLKVCRNSIYGGGCGCNCGCGCNSGCNSGCGSAVGGCSSCGSGCGNSGCSSCGSGCNSGCSGIVPY
jgi:hypothetical protein